MRDGQQRDAPPSAAKPRVVIVGAGFGGLWTAKELAGAPVDVVLVDRHNYHLFQPLLYQVATAALSPADIAAPIRAIVGGRPNVTVLLGKAKGVDLPARELIVDGRRIRYDCLVLATGARHAYFGRDDWEPFAPGLKEIEDAIEIRRRILLAFERAEYERDPVERRRNMTLIVVGGGPTGVELAGAIVELAKRALAADFHNIDPRSARIVLIEAGPRILPTFSEGLSARAQWYLEHLGVEVRVNTTVTAVDANGVVTAGERIESRTVIWAAGVAASPAGKWIAAERDRAGRIKVAPDLSVPGHPEIFAIGDTALALDHSGKPLPGTAAVAKQQGRYVGRLIRARLAARHDIEPFRYRHYGNLATIGRKAAVIEFGRFHLGGFLAWLVWSIAHIYFLIGFRNRLVVALNWVWNYFTFQRGARLITGSGR
ncbi:MAG TPA: NAD(P)/FAD-dependent oxidoreductase [Alphaproteobacteria bacterium]